MKYVLIAMLFSVCFTSHALASSNAGTIDPSGNGSYTAKFLQSGLGSINFGKFTHEPSANITINDSGIRGFAWSDQFGWIVMNCLDTASGCSSANGNFKVSVASDGTLSGYAWGQGTGWINFGPFANSNTSQVRISTDGTFGGVSSAAGYAWSAKYGWIVFDCSDTASCVETDYVPHTQRSNKTVIGSMPPTIIGMTITPPPSSEPSEPVVQPSRPVQPTTPPPASHTPQQPPQSITESIPPFTVPPALQQNNSIPRHVVDRSTPPSTTQHTSFIAHIQDIVKKALHHIGDVLHIQLSSSSGMLWSGVILTLIFGIFL